MNRASHLRLSSKKDVILLISCIIAIIVTINHPVIAAIWAYFRKFDSGELAPGWPHFWLLSISVLASFAVGAGIIFERPKYPPSVHRIAFWLVIGGIAIEALCTIFLFVFDEGISSAQKETIISLEKRLVPRKIDDPAVIVEKLKPFSGTPFSLGVQQGDETLGLLDQISKILLAAGWVWKDAAPVGELLNIPGKPKVALIVMRGGVEIRVSKNRVQQWGEAQNALAVSLAAAGVVDLAQVIDGLSDTTMLINVGTKP